MDSKLNLGFFPEWEYGNTMIMFSGDRKAIKKLERLFFDLANGVLKEIRFDKLDLVKSYKSTELFGFVSEKDEYIENVAGDNVFHWVLPQNKWEYFASLISGFNDRASERLGHGGHHYLDTYSTKDIIIMVSAEEYSDEWWNRNAL